jgi:hypothetical protein
MVLMPATNETFQKMAADAAKVVLGVAKRNRPANQFRQTHGANLRCGECRFYAAACGFQRSSTAFGERLYSSS